MITDRDSILAHVCLCGATAQWLSLYADPTCDVHRPVYDQHIASELVIRGMPGTAAAYRRTFQE